MNGAINQRFCAAIFSVDDGGHCDSEFFSKRQEAIDHAKRLIFKNLEKHRSRLFAEVSNMLQPKADPLRVDLTESDYAKAGLCYFCAMEGLLTSECISDHK